MKHNKAVLVCVIAVLAFTLKVKSKMENESVEEGFPSARAHERYFLPRQESGEEFRTEQYADDGVTRVAAERQFRDGVTEKVSFRSDGTISGYTQLFPCDNPRTLKSIALLDAAGRHFVFHKVFGPDGNLEREGELLPDGRYESKYYFDDGRTLARKRIFDKERKFNSETIYNRSGNPIVSRVKKGNELQTTLYRDDGTRSLFSVKSMVAETGKVFGLDGETLLFEYEQTPWSSREDYYDSNGVLVQGRIFVRMTGSIEVNVFNTDGSLRFKQVWLNGRKSVGQSIEAILFQVMEGKDQRLFRSIDLDKGGKPSSVTYPLQDGGRVVKTLLDGKRVVRTITYDRNNNLLSETGETDEEENIEPVLLQDPPHPERPSFVEDAAPPMVYDYK